MNDFTLDNNWQQVVRNQTLAPYYQRSSLSGRFVFADKGKLADILQREMSVDTIMTKKDGALLGIEEKIVRWPGYTYTAFTLETMSCTNEGHERKGWMHTAKCDILLYCFVQANGTDIIAYAIPFEPLQQWFFGDDRFEKYRKFVTTQYNHTETRIVPIADVTEGVLGTKRIAIAAPEIVRYSPPASINVTP